MSTSTMTVSATWCKICGIKDVDNARVAAAAGADAIGLNFVDSSPRFVDLHTAAEIASAVTCQRVGVFVDPTAEQVAEVLAHCPLDLLQFHGDESAPFCEQFELPYVKAVRMREGTDVHAIAAAHAGSWALMLDAFAVHAHGGTGHTFDWSAWPRNLDCRLVLAGGLNPDNVAGAILELQPFGVDVSGGIEVRKGVKDPERIRKFIAEVRDARRT